MSFHKCYICSNDTAEKKGFLSTGAFLHLCSNCNQIVNEQINKFPEHETRFNAKILGMRKFPEKKIHRNMIEVARTLTEGEVIVDYILGIYNSVKDTIIIPGFYEGIIILTNKRVLYFVPKPKAGAFGNKPVIGNSFEYTGSIDDIVEIKIETLKLDGSHLLIRDKGGIFGSYNKVISNDDPNSIEKFVKNFQKVKSNANVTQPAQGADNLEQLAKLKSLLDAGVLTEDEFAKKKEEILSRI